MENPLTWGAVEKTLDNAMSNAEEALSAGRVGASRAMQCSIALRQLGLLPNRVSDMPDAYQVVVSSKDVSYSWTEEFPDFEGDYLAWEGKEEMPDLIVGITESLSQSDECPSFFYENGIDKVVVYKL